MRCIEVVAPEGSLVNPRYPAPTGFGNHLSDQIAAVIMLALAPVVPRQVTACWNHLLATIVAGWSTRANAPYVDILINACKGGGGGTYGADGYDHIGLITSGGAIAAQDPEIFELVNPHFLHRFEYLQDSAGAGQWRGGLGVETVIELGGEEQMIAAYGDRLTEEPWGLFGGLPGTLSRMEITLPDGTVRHVVSKDLVDGIPPGSVLHKWTGGGGGFGDPFARDPERVAADVANGVVSRENGERLYGVAVDPVTRAVDAERTAELRGRPR
jgi:N-methylhydantoinase B